MWLENERVLSRITPRIFTCLETGMTFSPMETDEMWDCSGIECGCSANVVGLQLCFVTVKFEVIGVFHKAGFIT